MRTENANRERLLSRTAAAAIIKNRFCQDIAGGQVQQAAVAGARCESVARYNADPGKAVSCQYGPSDVIIEAGAVLADNADVMTDNVGRAVPALGATNTVLGRVINGSSASAAGQMVTIRFDPASWRVL